MGWLKWIGVAMELGAAGFIVWRACWSAKTFATSNEHFKSWGGDSDFVDAVRENASGQFRDQGIAFAVLVVGIVLQNI